MSLQPILQSWELPDRNIHGGSHTVILQVSKDKKFWRATTGEDDPGMTEHFKKDFAIGRDVGWWVLLDKTYDTPDWEIIRLYLINTLLPKFLSPPPPPPPYNDLDRFVDLE